MPDDKKATYPMLSAKSWWTLRKKLHDSPRVKVVDTFLASLLGMEVRSVRINALNYFKQIGLLDEDGSPTDLAMKWRDDENYADACQSIRQKCYPQELLDLFSGPNVDATAVERWFRNNAGVGASAATKQARFYLLLTKADVAEAAETPNKNSSGPTRKSQVKPPNRPVRAKSLVNEEQAAPPSEQTPPSASPVTHVSTFPSLHIDVQIHIAPDTSLEQIDRIFESMAKHLKGMGGSTAT